MSDRKQTCGTRRGNGPGLHGPAKGASASRIKPGDPDGIQAMSNDQAIKSRAADRREKVMQLYEDVVDDKRAPVMARLVAGDKLLDRIDGRPVALNINHNLSNPAQLSDDELVAIAAGGRREAPAEATPDPAEPGDVVH